MTAEIGLFNRPAVALAADSAVSIGNGGKVYDTENKLFTLSKYHPVGIMVYNSASFQRFPWETVIKAYRHKLGATSFPTIAEYRIDFLDFLGSHQFCSPKIEEAEILAEAHILANEAFVQAREAFFERLSTGDARGPEDAESDFLSFFENTKNRIQKIRFLTNFDDTDISEIRTKYSSLFETALINTLEHTIFAPLVDKIKDPFIELASHSLCRVNGFGPQSGIVIAGFGDDELLPSMEWLQIEGVISGKLRYYVVESLNMARDGDSAIVRAFAQQEMVHRFVDGVDPQLFGYLRDLQSRQIEAVLDSVVSAVATASGDSALANSIRDSFIANNIAQNATDAFHTACQHHIVEQFQRPLLMMAQHLPKDELGNLAESLVSLTALKRKVSPEHPSVGGPIDVAIISKGDGFIWYRRKHYFKSELNPHFFDNYFRS